MRTSPIRGAIGAETLLVLTLVTLLAVKTPSGGPGKKHWWEFWRKNPIEQVDKANAKVDAAQTEIDTATADQLRVAQDAAHATGSAIAAAQEKTAAGELPVKELATAKKLNATNTAAMDQALGAPSPERLRELETMVANLTAGVAAGERALQLLDEKLDRAVEDKAAAMTARDQAIAERDQLVAKLQTFAGERDAIARRYERLTFFAKLAAVAGALVLAYVLVLLIRTRRLGSFVKDAVGMTEMLKSEIRQRASAEEYAAIKERMASDWMTVRDGTAALVAKAKEELRL